MSSLPINWRTVAPSLKHSSSTDSKQTAAPRLIAFYFSALFCPPCHKFTEKLKAIYPALLEYGGVKVIFVSSDRSEEDFKKYYSTMPWSAIRYKEEDLRHDLMSRFNV